jgi:hypothetical protein
VRVGGFVFHTVLGVLSNSGHFLQCIWFYGLNDMWLDVFFHIFAIFRGKNPPCWAVRFVCCGIGSALHVSFMVSEILSIMASIEEHAFCH